MHSPFQTLAPSAVARVGLTGTPRLGSRLQSALSGLLPQSPWHQVALITLLAAALRVHGIDTDGYWKNELFSLTWIRNSTRFLAVEGLLTETNPPFYYLLLKAWTGIFGTAEAGARSLTVLISIATVPLTFALGRALGGNRVGIIAAFLLAITPVQIYFAQEARVYAFLPFFVTLTLLGVCRFLAPLQVPVPRDGELPRTPGLVLYTAGAIGLLQSHATSVFTMTALAGTVFVVLLDMRAPRAIVSRFFVASLIAALTASPIVGAMLMQVDSPNVSWMPRFGPETLMIVDHFMLLGPLIRSDFGENGSRLLALGQLGMAIVAAIMLFITARRAIHNRHALALVLLFPLFFIVLTGAISLFKPILIPRIALWTSVPICLAAGFVLASRIHRPLRVITGGLLLACLGIGLINNCLAPTQHKPDWRHFVADNRPDDTTGPLLVAGPHIGPLGLAVYATTDLVRDVRHWAPYVDRPLMLSDRVERAATGALPVTTAELTAIIRGGGHVRLFLDEGDQSLIVEQLMAMPEFSAAIRSGYPGLTVFTW